MELDNSRKILGLMGLVGLVAFVVGVTVTALIVDHYDLMAWVFILCLVNTVLVVGLFLRYLLCDVFEVIE